MRSGGGEHNSPGTSVRKREYSAESTTRHRSSSANRRRLFFGLASLWGFIAGVVGLLISMSFAGQPVRPSEAAIPGLIPTAVVAVGGGYVMAAAYNESKRRSRR